MTRPETPRKGPRTTSTSDPSLISGHTVVLQFGRHENPIRFDLSRGNRYRLTLDGYHPDDAPTVPDHFDRHRGEANETIAREQRPVDLLAPILPAAPPREGRQKRLRPLTLQFLVNELFTSGPRVNREPAHGLLLVADQRSHLAPQPTVVRASRRGTHSQATGGNMLAERRDFDAIGDLLFSISGLF